MMSTARSSQARPADACRVGAALVALLMMCALPFAVQARDSDRGQPIQITADYSSGSGKPNSKVHLKGHVVIVQGTLTATGARAIGYLDAHSRVKRVLLTGTPAHLRQIDDHGNLVKGHAARINYDIPKAIATLTGDACVTQVGRGKGCGATLVYNTTTSVMTAKSKGDKRVHLTFQPRQAGAGNTHPAPASSSGSH